MARDDRLLELVLSVLHGLDLGGHGLGVRVEILNSRLELVGARVDLRREGGDFACVGRHHGLQFDLVVLHPGQLLVAAAEAEQQGDHRTEANAARDPTSALDSLRFSHDDSFHYV